MVMKAEPVIAAIDKVYKKIHKRRAERFPAESVSVLIKEIQDNKYSDTISAYNILITQVFLNKKFRFGAENKRHEERQESRISQSGVLPLRSRLRVLW